MNAKYCVDCGSLMGFKRKAKGFSDKSGKPIYQIIYKCPQRKFWHFTKHAEIEDFEYPADMETKFDWGDWD